jgi:hypothetical protein
VQYWYCCIVDARRHELECCRRGVCTAAICFIRPAVYLYRTYRTRYNIRITVLHCIFRYIKRPACVYLYIGPL